MNVTFPARARVILPRMSQGSLAAPIVLGAVAGLMAAVLGAVAIGAAAGVVGLTLLGTGRS